MPRWGTYAANAFGLHEVSGNVWEWCRDWYGGYSAGVEEGDGEREVVGSSDAHSRVLRGGGFLTAARLARSAARVYVPEVRDSYFGCRPARAVITQ